MLKPSTIEHFHSEPETGGLIQEMLDGLRQPQKELPDVLLYDERGSQLYDIVCETPAYYLTHTELSIMRRDIGEMAYLIGENALLIEYGSGSSLKTQVLLENLPGLAGYIPIDISKEHLLKAAGRITEKYPHIRVLPVYADYSTTFRLPSIEEPANLRLAYYPGSSIGHWEPEGAVGFLKQIREVCGNNGALLIGVDLKKEAGLLVNAYGNQAVKDFVLNILSHINHRFGANFNSSNFRQEAHYNEGKGRVEVCLVSNLEQEVRVGNERFSFREGEKIKISHAYKYSVAEFEALAAQAGWQVQQVWRDGQNLFSVQYLKPK